MSQPPPPPNQQKPSFMSFSNQKPPVANHTEQNQHFSDLNRRVRMTEESLANLRKKIELENENRLSESRKVQQDINDLYSEVHEVKKSLKTLREDFTKMIQEIQQFAKKEDVQTLQKYLELFKPVNFVTQDEIEQIVAYHVQTALRKENKISINDNQIKQQTQQQDILQTQNSTDILTTDIQESQTQTVTIEQKKKIALFIEEHPDIQQMLLEKPEKLQNIIQEDPYLQKLFANVDVNELSQKMKRAYEDS